MLCRDCQVLANADGVATGDGRPGRERRDQLCTRCGHLLGSEDTVKQLHRKESQLKRFGLSGHRPPLTKPRGGR
jgi:hypothetical protein